MYNSAYWPPATRIFEDTHSPFPPFIQRTATDKPSEALRNHELGARYNLTRGIWDMSLIYFSTWDDLPTTFFRSGTIDPVLRRPTRIHQMGLATDTFFQALDRQWIWRVEAMYTLNKYIGLKSMPGIAPWLASNGNVTKRNTLKSASSIETTLFHGDVTVIFQPVFNYVFGFDNHMNARHIETIFIGGLTQPIHYFDDRIRYSLTWYYFAFSKSNGWKYKYDLSYEISDYMSLRYTGYSGHNDEAYGMYDDWDNFGIEFGYQF